MGYIVLKVDGRQIIIFKWRIHDMGKFEFWIDFKLQE